MCGAWVAWCACWLAGEAVVEAAGEAGVEWLVVEASKHLSPAYPTPSAKHKTLPRNFCTAQLDTPRSKRGQPAAHIIHKDKTSFNRVSVLVYFEMFGQWSIGLIIAYA